MIDVRCRRQECCAASSPAQDGLYWLKGGQLGSVTDAKLGKDVVYSIDGHKGELWVGRQQKGVTHLRYEGTAFKANTYMQAQGLAQNRVYVVHVDRDSTVWAGTLTGGLSRFRDGDFKTYTAVTGLASDSVSAIADGSDGTTWIGTPNGLTLSTSLPSTLARKLTLEPRFIFHGSEMPVRD